MNKIEYSIKGRILLFTKTFDVTTLMLEAMSDTFSDIMLKADSIRDEEIKVKVMYECRYIKRSLRSICSQSHKNESRWLQDVRLFNRISELDVLLKSCEHAKIDILEVSKILNKLIAHTDKAIDYIDQYKVPFKHAKQIIKNYDEQKAKVYKKLINNKKEDMLKLEYIRRNMILSKNRLRDINKRCISAISKYNAIKDMNV